MALFCRLCLINVEGENAFLNITENEDLLIKIQVLLPNMAVSLTDNTEICKDCGEGVQYAYNFCQNVLHHDHEVSNKETELICKLCFKVCSEADLVPLLGIDKIPFQSIMMVLETAVPELNLELSEESFMCNTCWNTAKTVCNFKKKWLETEDRLQSYLINVKKDKLTEIDIESMLSQEISDENLKVYNFAIDSCNETEVFPDDLKIKKEDIENYIYQDVNSECDVVPKVEGMEGDIKYEVEEDIANDSDINFDEDVKVDIAKLEKDSNDTSGGDNKSKNNGSSSKNSEIHQCQHCSYKTNNKQNLRRHLFTHNLGNNSQVKMHKCDQCFYQHYRKDHFNDHMRTHAAKNDNASVKNKLFKCEHCSFTSLRKENVKQHFKQKHDTTPPSIKCEQCPYVGKLKAHLASHMIPQKKSRKSLTLKDKLELIAKFEKGVKNRELCEQYNLSHSTISGIIQNKDTIKQTFEVMKNKRGNAETIKKCRLAKENQLETTLYSWLCQMRASGVPVSGVRLQNQAKIFHDKIYEGYPEKKEFKASAGWLTKFKERYGLRTHQLNGEKMSADLDAWEQMKEQLQKIMAEENYDIEEIFSGDEFGLEFQSLPNQTLALSSENEVSGFKQTKKRITVMACANATGTHKIPLMVIGNVTKPKCFKNKQLPFEYKGQKSAWMTEQLFFHWFQNVFIASLTTWKPNGKFLLILDSAPVHPPAEELNAIDERVKVIFLPPNITSILQSPMDQSPISFTKKFYRTEFLKELLSQTYATKESFITFVKKWSILDCMHALKRAWNKVSQATLKNAWKKLIPSIALEPSTTASSKSIGEIVDLLNRIPTAGQCSTHNAEDWIESDRESEVYQMLSDQELFCRFAGFPMPEDESEQNSEVEEEDENNEEEEIEETVQENVSPRLVHHSVRHLIKWANEHPDITDSDREVLSKIRDIVLNSIRD